MKTKINVVVSVLLLAVTMVIAGTATAAQSPQVPIAGSAIPQFMQPLPTLSITGGTIKAALGNTNLTIKMCEFRAAVLPPGAVLNV